MSRLVEICPVVLDKNKKIWKIYDTYRQLFYLEKLMLTFGSGELKVWNILNQKSSLEPAAQVSCKNLYNLTEMLSDLSVMSACHIFDFSYTCCCPDRP